MVSPLIGLVFPSRCGVCGRHGVSPCGPCGLELVQTSRTDPRWVRLPVGCASIHAPFEYHGAARELIRSAKYRSNVAGLAFAAGHMVRSLGARADSNDVVSRIDVVTWVPTSPSRRRKRGFDQAELLAAHVALLLGVPKVRLLQHVRDPGSQTGRSRIARLQRSHTQMFVPANRAGFGCFDTVLLVDDVVTTGGTLSAAVRMLKDNGSNTVHAVVAAATL